MFAAGQERAGTMAAVIGLSMAEVEAVCQTVSARHGVVVVANHNSASQIAISGENAAVAAAGDALKSAGARRVVPLNVSGAFHSPLLEEAAAAFRSFLTGLTIRDANVPLVANVSAAPGSSAEKLRRGFERQLTAPVLWQDTMDVICQPENGDRPRVVLEVGPGKVLSGLAKRAYPDTLFLTMGTGAELEELPRRLGEIL
jgi:[acyl-carrier-protein] S-malonyltransferase